MKAPTRGWGPSLGVGPESSVALPSQMLPARGVSAWAIEHSDAIGQIDVLAPLLAGVIAEIRSL